VKDEICVNGEMIAGITEMEKRLDDGAKIVKDCIDALEKYREYRHELDTLFAYYGSPEWFAAFDASNEGRLPKGLKCGVLSEDAVYNLIADNRCLLDLMEQTTDEQEDKRKMKYNITFLGTCACDYSPLLKGECADRFDDNARRASCLTFNDRFMIDCGPHALDSLRIAGIDKARITDLFITHLHSDHYNPENIAEIAAASAERRLRIWVSEGAVIPEIANAEVIYMEKFAEYDVTDDLKVTGMSANHDKNAHPQHLLFDLCGRKFMYGCDGAWLLNDTYYHMKNAGLALCILDGTCGDKEGEFRIAEHNTIPMIRLMLPSMKTVGIINDETCVMMSHIAPSLHKPHDEIVKAMEDVGVLVAYDGMKIEI